MPQPYHLDDSSLFTTTLKPEVRYSSNEIEHVTDNAYIVHAAPKEKDDHVAKFSWWLKILNLVSALFSSSESTSLK